MPTEPTAPAPNTNTPQQQSNSVVIQNNFNAPATTAPATPSSEDKPDQTKGKWLKRWEAWAAFIGVLGSAVAVITAAKAIFPTTTPPTPADPVATRTEPAHITQPTDEPRSRAQAARGAALSRWDYLRTLIERNPAPAASLTDLRDRAQSADDREAWQESALLYDDLRKRLDTFESETNASDARNAQQRAAAAKAETAMDAARTRAERAAAADFSPRLFRQAESEREIALNLARTAQWADALPRLEAAQTSYTNAAIRAARVVPCAPACIRILVPIPSGTDSVSAKAESRREALAQAEEILSFRSPALPTDAIRRIVWERTHRFDGLQTLSDGAGALAWVIDTAP
ncbi:MAG: hypothetical protein AB7G17_08860 [Phycisphaerales bacterium]